MSFSAKYLPVARHEYFLFFASNGDGAVPWNSEMDEQFDPSHAFILDKIRLHLSTAHISAVSFVATLSHHIGSAYNEIIISQTMVGVLDLLYQADPPRYFYPGDTFSFAMPMSATNTYGLEITGWAITQKLG